MSLQKGVTCYECVFSVFSVCLRLFEIACTLCVNFECGFPFMYLRSHVYHVSILNVFFSACPNYLRLHVYHVSILNVFFSMCRRMLWIHVRLNVPIESLCVCVCVSVSVCNAFTFVYTT